MPLLDFGCFVDAGGDDESRVQTLVTLGFVLMDGAFGG